MTASPPTLAPVRALWRRHLRRRREARHRSDVLGIARGLEKHRGGAAPDLGRRARDYAGDVLGSVSHAPWLYVYALTAGAFREGWIPEDYYGAEVIPRLNGPQRRLSAFRSLPPFFAGHPACADLAYAANGLFFSAALEPVPERRLPALIFAAGPTAVFKTDASARGRGIHLLDRDGFDPAALRALGSGVIQRRLRQHPALDPISPGGTATLRVTTVLDDDGGVAARGTNLRVGRAGEGHLVSRTALKVAVDAATGRSSRALWGMSWLPAERHPDTGAAFDGIALAGYHEALATLAGLHRRLPMIRVIGWDVALDADGRPGIMEWNAGHPGIKFPEATQGPCFAGLGWERLWRR